MPEVAEPLAASAQSTVTVWALRLDSATVKVSVALPASPSVTDGLSMVSAGAASASVMAPVPSSVSAPPARSALTALNSRRMTVSSSSATSSPLTVTSMVWLVWFGLKVSVPLASFA